MKTEETIKLIKYVTGSVAAVLLAAAMQLQFAYAAGIITLLTCLLYTSDAADE